MEPAVHGWRAFNTVEVAFASKLVGVARRMNRRRWLIGAALVSGVGLLLWPDPKKDVLDVLDDLCASANAARDAAGLATLKQALAARVTPNFSVRVGERGDTERGLSDVFSWSTELLTGPPLTFSWVDAEAHVEGNQARVQANLLVSVRGSSEQRRGLRPTLLRLRSVNGSWRLESVVVEREARERPEARP